MGAEVKKITSDEEYLEIPLVDIPEGFEITEHHRQKYVELSGLDVPDINEYYYWFTEQTEDDQIGISAIRVEKNGVYNMPVTL